LGNSLTRAAPVGCFGAISSLLLSAVSAYADCATTNQVVRTSRVAMQVWSGTSPAEGALVSLIWEHRHDVPAATGETDSQGALQIDGVPTGLYSLQVTLKDRSPVLTNGKRECHTESASGSCPRQTHPRG